MTNILVVGAGSIGKRHIRNFKAHGCDVEAVEVNETARINAEKETGVKIHPDLKTALESKKFDGAIIGVPARFHVECALECAKKGIHLLVEKPLFLDFVERHTNETEEQHKARADKEKKNLTELFSTIKEKNLVAMIGYMNRHSEQLKFVKKILDDKVIGNAATIYSENSHNAAKMHPLQNVGSWFVGHKEMGGDTMLEDSHGLNTLQFLFGEIEEVACYTGKLTSETVTSFDNMDMIVKFKDGRQGTVHTDLYCVYGNRNDHSPVLVRGTKGVIVWDRGGDNTVKVKKAFEENLAEEITQASSDNRDSWFITEEKEFLDCIKNNRQAKPEFDLKSGYETMAVIMAASLSNREKRTVKISEIFRPY